MDLKITRNGSDVTMPIDTLTHIASCLSNQKFLGKWNADAAMDSENSKQIDQTNQEAIDQCFSELMRVSNIA